jgi:RecB family exonuclease
MGDVTLLEAPSPRDEAIAIAAILRDAAGRGERAALVTPDRVLARRVTAALGRWGIVPDDSAGEPLAQTVVGRILRQIAALFGQKLPMASLLALLKHPLVCLGEDRGAHLLATRELELHLRRNGPAFVEPDTLLRWGEKADRGDWARAVAAVIEARDAPSSAGITDWVARLLRLADILGNAGRTGLWTGPAGRQASLILAALDREGPVGPTLTAEGFRDLLGRSLATEGKRDPVAAHPLVAIWGTLEARVENAALTILGGLNEGGWPETDSPDPWLSRPMRRAAGLRPPERTIGLAAHDFQQAAAAPRIVLSRSRRDSEAETVPSRWLARLTNLLDGLPRQSGPEALAAMRARGEGWLALARAIEEPVPADAALRPAPRPPVTARPRRLSVTDVRSLVRNPYHVYASKILRLRRLDPLSAVPDYRDRGKALHRIAERLVAERVADEDQAGKTERLMRIAGEVLAEEVPWVAVRRMWQARFAPVAERLAGSEQGRETAGQAVILEEGGRLYIPEIDFTLVARPDRIDQRADGRIAIYDYKSSVPEAGKMAAYEHQLALEAEMALRGGFPGVDARVIDELLYIGLGNARAREEREVPKDGTEMIWRRFLNLIRIYDRAETGYVARIYQWDSEQPEDYDHLSRYGEWGFEDPLDESDVP